MEHPLYRKKMVFTALLVLLLPVVHALTLSDNVELYLPFDAASSGIASTTDLIYGREVTCYSSAMDLPHWDTSAGYAEMNDSFCVVPAFDMGASFTVCTRFSQEVYTDALLSTYGDDFERSGGAFELFINSYDPESLQAGVILDADLDLIEIDTLGIAYTLGDWHTVCATYDGGTTPDAFRLYYDGAPAPQTSSVAWGSYPGGYNATRDFVIMAGNPQGTFSCIQCMQDTIIVYKDRVLTADEVADLSTRLSNGEEYPFTPVDGAMAQEVQLFSQALEEVQASESSSTSAVLAEAGITPGLIMNRLESAYAEALTPTGTYTFMDVSTSLVQAIAQEVVTENPPQPSATQECPVSQDATELELAIAQECELYVQTLHTIMDSEDARSPAAILAGAGITPGQIKNRLESRLR